MSGATDSAFGLSKSFHLFSDNRPTFASSNDEAIVRALIALAQRLNLTIITVRIETVEQADLLRREEGDEAPGYRYDRPRLAAGGIRVNTRTIMPL